MGLSFDRIGSLLTAYPALVRLRVAYSGGVDSHVLLHLLATHRGDLGSRTLAAVYVDHGLQPDAGSWGRHCEVACRALGVEFDRIAVDARPATGESPEAAARRARYHVLTGLMGEHEALLTAHHLDDQAETLLLQLLRGAGPHGLAAMPPVAPLGPGLLLRPLLGVERADILAYAEAHGLIWVEDESNAQRGPDRNYLRHEVLPRLRARWPAAARTLARSARLCAEDAALLDGTADADLAAAGAGRPDCLDGVVLLGLPEARRRNALRRWLRLLGLPVPSAVQLCHILRDVLQAPRDREPCVRWPGAEVRRFRDRLFAMPPLRPHDPTRVLPWPGAGQVTAILEVPGMGRLGWRAVRGGGLRPEELAAGPLTVRFRRGGERFRPRGRRHGQELKKLLQEAGVPPWERYRLPLLYRGEDLVAVAGLGVAADLAARAGETGLVLDWQKRLPSDTF